MADTGLNSQPMADTLSGDELDGEIVTVDSNVLDKLPDIRTIISFRKEGTSAWARTFRISAEMKNGSEESFFLKNPSSNASRSQWGFTAGKLHGEYESTLAMYNVSPDFVPKPLGWGSFKSLSDTHFYLCKYRHLGAFEDIPEPAKFCEKLAYMHKHGNSPNGKYGFHITTYCGNVRQNNTWSDTWEGFFTNNLKHIVKLCRISGGPGDEFEELLPALFEKIIPRLLRPLETGGNSIKPSLVHGDLWCGNAGFDKETDEPLIFDACCGYFHNEYEMGDWRPLRNKFNSSYFTAYQAHFPPAAPEADYNDRNLLYSCQFNLHAATMFPDSMAFLQMVIDAMRILVNKFPGGYEEYKQNHS